MIIRLLYIVLTILLVSGSVQVNGQSFPDKRVESESASSEEDIPFYLRFNYQDSTYLDQPLYSILNGRGFIGGYIGLKGSLIEYQGERQDPSFDISQLSPIIQIQLRNLRIYQESEIDLLNFNLEIYDLWASYRILPWIGIKAGYFKVPNSIQNILRAEAIFVGIDRPFLTTEILGSNYSDFGIGLEGSTALKSGLKVHYEILSHLGYNEKILYTPESHTDLHEGTKRDDFRVDNNDEMHFTCFLDLREENKYRIGGSLSSGNYRDAGSDKLQVSTYSIHSSIFLGKLIIQAEVAGNQLELPESIDELYGDNQLGIYAGLAYPIYQNNYVLDKPSRLMLNVRYDYIDHNRGVFQSTTENIRDEVTSAYGGLSYHYNLKSAVKLGVYRSWTIDLLGNPPLNERGVQVAIASYF